ncbi:uncharacterized protein LOC132717467 [Ruditapes philippinarum]|uniref:uncharacterized protein LOC132717467 n=1 Tax=Ruditapes philippinarum TaxID=129788 RepID=UPI00295A6351|nr:uncharacterized protein LOC132717467 [Ruditapes philippinarum]
MENSGSFERSWVHTVDKKIETLILADGSFEETVGQNNKYVLTIYMLSVSMNGRYSVYCGERLLYTNDILIKLPEPPNTPVIIGLQNIENCRNCIVGEDNEMFKLACEIHGGTPPLTITMTIGKESYIPLEWNSTTYIVHFTVRDNHHMENVIISVMNDALLSPLNVTAQMFVIKPPTFQVSVPEILRDGEAVNITCTIDDGRPNPNVYLSISGSAVSSVDSHFYNSTTSLHTNIITLTTFKKEWNKENITCCRYNEWYKIVRDCPPPKQVNYQFPPTYVMLEVKVDEHRLSRMYATCTVYDSNPACSVQFSAPSGIIGSEKSSENVRLPHGAWNSVYEVNLNVSEEDNGKDVTCIVECDEFPVDLTDTVKILLPFPPVIRFNISGSTLNISEGDRAHVKCEAESVPASNISWTEELSNEHITKKQCDLSPNCVLNINTDEVSNRRFMCHVHYKTKVDHKYLTVQIIANPDGREAGDYMSKTGTNETCVSLGAVVGSVIGVLAVGILIGVICTLCILTRKGIIAGSKTQPTVSRDIELTGPPTALDTYEQLQNRADTEIRGTYDSLEVNSRVQQNSQSQYESLNQDAEQYHTYTDLKQSQ